MGRRLENISKLIAVRQCVIEPYRDAGRMEVEGLRELRQIAGKGQAEIASALNIKQPSVSKIENQADMYLSTLKTYVEAVGGKLELVVKLPKRPALRIHQLGEAISQPRTAPSRRAVPREAKPRHG
ncbi:XRE family transcriptional regulator [Mesorhizobium sp.]|uniref:XRE family transcriptional regulator n=1 Tax=Mesorhizobium sp. TaxID=1871066 RepID=UPI0025D3B4C8|nr:XRE family transcriptional regulator [Mesorhizobium sp.]